MGVRPWAQPGSTEGVRRDAATSRRHRIDRPAGDGNVGDVTEQTETPEPRVLTTISGPIGHVSLNRPRAINALDLDMIELVTEALDAWAHDPAVEMVLIDGTGDRGLCAGGDVRGLYEQITAGHPEATGIFFRAEYGMNARIAEYPKPIIAVADGITMGGGIGLAGHATVRIVTERSKLAMPETRIGFTPDVGGTWLLGRAPGRLGEYLGLTGTAMDAADALYAGFADHFVPSDRLNALYEALQKGGPDDVSDRVAQAIAEAGHDADAGPSRLETQHPWIDDAFSADTVDEIVRRLHARPEPDAAAAIVTLRELSPTGLAVTLEAVRRARELPDVRHALTQEYGLVMWFAATQPDLIEGIRAQLVDKDRTPHWQPATIEELTADAVISAFDYEPADALWGSEVP